VSPDVFGASPVLTDFQNSFTRSL